MAALSRSGKLVRLITRLAGPILRQGCQVSVHRVSEDTKTAELTHADPRG